MINILIVEDDKNKCFCIIKHLNSSGIHEPFITVSDNITDALSLMGKHRYQILILDLNLPMRHNLTPVKDGGTNILYKLGTEDIITPTHTIGLTSHDILLHEYKDSFQEFDCTLLSYTKDEWKATISRRIDILRSSIDDQYKIPSEKDVIILVHGVLTNGVWQNRLIEHFKDSFYCYPYSYSFYSGLKIAFPWTRKKQEFAFKEYLYQIIKKHPSSSLYIISHSFGTHLTIKALEDIQYNNKINIPLIFFLGSVIRSDYKFYNIQKKYEIQYILNDIGINDKALIFSKLFCFGLGHAGRIGFNSSSIKVINRYHKGGHDIYNKNGFIERFWVEQIKNPEQAITPEYCFKNESNVMFENIISFFTPPLTWSILAMSCFALYYFS
ncbi:response regulator [Aeromonas hydrophila]|nr:response regulator [Aeromonas hydrophila]